MMNYHQVIKYVLLDNPASFETQPPRAIGIFQPRSLPQTMFISRSSVCTAYNRGDHPQMAQQFRLVNYLNLPSHTLITLPTNIHYGKATVFGLFSEPQTIDFPDLFLGRWSCRLGMTWCIPRIEHGSQPYMAV